MPPDFLLHLALGLVPVLLFLGGLLLLDSFRLVGPGLIAAVLAMGAAAAVGSYFAGGALIDALHLSYPGYSHFVAPFVEEGLKAAAILLLFRLDRIGFLVDAAIVGLGVGAGFALLENIYYALNFPDANLALWLVRGLGTALMHGGVTAIFALAAQATREDDRIRLVEYVPGFLIAVALHAIYNQFTSWPMLSAAGTLVTLPLMLLFLFDRSEHQVHDWLIHDYEDRELLLKDIRTGRFRESPAGRAITGWARNRDPELLDSVMAYLKLHTELVLSADALLLVREGKGQATPVDPDAFDQLRALEQRIGRAALLTLRPHLKFSRRQLFELHCLERQAMAPVPGTPGTL